MIKRTIFYITLLSAITLNTAMASVTVEINQQQYKFDHSPSVAEVLAPVAMQQNWYWPATALFEIGKSTQLEETRQLVVDTLTRLIKRHQKSQPETSSPLTNLRDSIANWRLASRLPTKIDYDLARLLPAQNPQMPAGNYLLTLAPRKNSVQLFGAVNRTSNVPHLAHTDVSEYVAKQVKSDLANNDYVVILQADGRIINAPVAYWNRNHQEVMPSSQLFVPFKETLFSPEFALLNQQITTLALHRVQS
ncbi:capsule biosynthesis GfcC family protein [Paraglaciecola aquimarina]|uniref:Capsule biosynthesis GfcC family protein n=1 Tax=Paraglaciecola aquimarina TaxID=1235557 RepID=A0ABU3T1F7_9ALTE|nr:capsule biosynthesis GfcC family protein [Paraglaciecola aquimarina]MDU0356101.1 capsule biosynthesis GfcC family protein [Paraglaciecola aquimarina]